jgi:hypothetical protein
LRGTRDEEEGREENLGGTRDEDERRDAKTSISLVPPFSISPYNIDKREFEMLCFGVLYKMME